MTIFTCPIILAICSPTHEANHTANFDLQVVTSIKSTWRLYNPARDSMNPVRDSIKSSFITK